MLGTPARRQAQPDEQSGGRFTGLVNPSSPGARGLGSCPGGRHPGGLAGTGQPTGAVAYESPRERAEGVLVQVSDVPALPTLGPSQALGLGRHWAKKG